jgi:excisionase family DNA binding protein
MKEIMTAKEAAEYLRIPLSSLYKLTHFRKIPFIKCGRLLRFRRTKLDLWLASREVPPINDDGDGKGP